MAMNLRQVVDELNKNAREIGGDLENTIGSHKSSAHLYVHLNGEQETIEFDIDSIELNYRIGCSCPDGVTIFLKHPKLNREQVDEIALANKIALWGDM